VGTPQSVLDQEFAPGSRRLIDEPLLRNDLIRLLTATENNIRTRCDEEPSINRPLEERYQAARQAGRTGMTFGAWREGEITQAGVAWLLACVFVRFLEDNDFLGQVYLAGPGPRLKAAQDRRTAWYRSHAASSDREYLLDIFSELEHLPGLKGLLDRAHNPLWSLGPDGDGAKAIWDFFQSADPDTQVLNNDFTDTARSTRFLGDLYQNISESARKRFALLQTPDFIVDFILNHTLEQALKEFPLDGFRIIDPACGSGHFLLEAFDRLFRRWAMRDGNLTIVVQNALDCIYGVDLNPCAAAIARFRLLVAALLASGLTRLSHAPDWPIHVIAGDSLLFGPNKMVPSLTSLHHEEPDQLRLILQTQRFHVVVGNPPYINVQDPELRRLYRGYYKSCSGKYQISVPFTELFFDLAQRDGHVGMITSNAFMKRSFGKKLVEEYMPCWDLTYVLDSSGVYIPGHGTPTAILIGRNRLPVSPMIRVVRGIRGEITAPIEPANAPVWSEIRDRLDQPGFDGQYVSVANANRDSFHRHPWSVGGGGATELKERLDDCSALALAGSVEAMGITSVTGEDDVYLLPDDSTAVRLRAESARHVVIGDDVRDWAVLPSMVGLWPYDDDLKLKSLSTVPAIARILWLAKAVISGRKRFGTPMLQRGLTWYEWQELYTNKLRTPLSITSAFVSTHNQFALDRGGNVFKQSAPVIKLPQSASEDDHVGLLGILQSSAGGFWFRQVCRNKGTGGIGGGLATENWEQFFEYDSTKVSQLPLPDGRPLEIAAAIQAASEERLTHLPAALVAREIPTHASLDAARKRAEALLTRMIALQEELDWKVYQLYGLLEESLTLPIDQVPSVQLGERSFEIIMARAVESGELRTEWFTRHRSTQRISIPEHWPEPYRDLVQRRLDTIARDRDIALIEQPEYKRRWNLLAWDELEQDALRRWLLDRMEDTRYWPTDSPALTSITRLADAVRADADFLHVAELYRGRPDFDLTHLVHELVAGESVPFLPSARYKESGLRKRADWERTWELQRLEDGGEKVEIPVPPKYERTDFLADYWRLRGKLDVPKERWISYPNLEPDADKSPVIAWAGYDHGQQALALAGYANEMRTNEGWTTERLIPVLSGLKQLQPWLDQWHNKIDPDRQQRLNESIRTFVESEMTQLGITAERIRDWRPPARVSLTRSRRAGPRTAAASEPAVPNE
jgi:hypothetical protein